MQCEPRPWRCSLAAPCTGEGKRQRRKEMVDAEQVPTTRSLELEMNAKRQRRLERKQGSVEERQSGRRKRDEVESAAERTECSGNRPTPLIRTQSRS
eukprot:ctg_256.g150